jgi:hypothetical protein
MPPKLGVDTLFYLRNEIFQNNILDEKWYLSGIYSGIYELFHCGVTTDCV